MNLDKPATAPDKINELHTLSARLLELERESADAREQARLLATLHEAFTTIAQTRGADDIVAHVLRAAFAPLGFSRAVFFGVDRERGIEARWQIDGCDAVEASFEQPDLRPQSALLAVLRGDTTESIGCAGELSAPFVDVRGWYIVSCLNGTEAALGVLYVDGHRSSSPRTHEANAVRALTTIAAVCIENGLLLAKTQEMAARDPLTGLYNRRMFTEQLISELEVARRTGRSLAYVMIDVDDFKKVNDRLGHAGGDATLKRVADALVRSSRSHDIVARYAGDEFQLALTNLEPALAYALVARLSWELRAQNLSCSIGAALYPNDGSSPEALAVAADRALYATKAAGKNGFSFA